jgi:peptidoglycan-associated lipoprotein
MKPSSLINNKLLMLCIAAFFVTACQTPQDQFIDDTTTLDQAQFDEGIDGSLDGTDSDPSALDDSSVGSAIAFEDETVSARAMLDDTDSPLSSRVIYFEFDSAKINEDSLTALESHGSFIASNGNVSVRLEGHSDERGSREYNIALGDRRAQSVRRVLLFQGASVDQLETISYGEEQPAELGHNEDAWLKNRRVELVYQVN